MTRKKTLPIRVLLAKTLFVLLVSSFVLPIYGQTENTISLRLEKTTLVDFFKAVEKNSELRFSYITQNIDNQNDVSVNATNENVELLVKKVLTTKGYTYKRTGNTIAVLKTTKNNTSPLKKITGLVTDEKGEPIIGASIIDNVTKTGTITDVNGNFTIDASDKTTLSISYIGYTTTNSYIGSQNSLTIRLEEDSKALDEVVVVGYGTTKKVNLTGAVASIDVKTLETRPSANILQSIQGAVPGVTIINRPGGTSINIRGRGNLGSSAPLYIVDGIEVDWSFFNGLEPSSIEAMSFLKDAASAAIYGAKAAYGVILVTTKSGKSGELKISYNGSYGSNSPTVLPKVLSSWQYADMYRTAEINSGILPANLTFDQDDIEMYRSGTNLDIYPNTNWFDLILKKSSTFTKHNFEFSGGSDKIKYVLGMGYLKNESLIPGEVSDRYNFNTKMTADFKPWLKVISNVNVMYDAYKRQGHTSFRGFLAIPPTQVARQSDGNYGSVRDMRANDVDGNSNPLFGLEMGGRANNGTINFLGTMAAEIKPFKGFTITNQVGYKYLNYRGFNFSNSFPGIPSYLNPGTMVPGSAKAVNEMNMDWQYSQKLIYDGWINYEKTFNSLHSISLVAGTHADTYIWQNLNVGRQGFPINDLNAIDAGSTDPVNQLTTWGTINEESILSYFGRITYAFDQKYLFEANFRSDASSRFAEKGRWGYFPSFSSGWRIDKEKFMSKLDWIDGLKLRASWGQNGNINNVGLYDTYSSYITSGTYVMGGVVSPVLAEGRVGNANLSWETTSASDIGLDLDIKNGLFSLTADVYNRTTDNILIRANDILSETGLNDYQIPARNVGTVQNKGLEVALSHRKELGDFSYKIGGNMSFNENRILDLGPNVDQLPPSGNYILRKGGSIGDFYMLQSNGLYSSEDITSGNVIPYGQQVPEAGMIKFVDQLTVDTDNNGVADKGDGVINDKDKTVVGSDVPSFTYGFNLELKYKDFMLSAMGQGVTGIQVLMDAEASQAFFDKSVPREWQLDNWTADNQNAVYPRILLPTDVRFVYNSYKSSFWLFDASYFRIKNITLSYNVPTRFTRAIGLEKARVYITGDNQFTIRGDKRMKDFDPERGSGRGAELGLKTVTAGVSITL